MEQSVRNGPLSPYRILDLTTADGWLAGKVLADLGAAVIKIEPPAPEAPTEGGTPGE
jgi:crotonobetainyl-CoA:carnitine CoA-transferase CaiB-like acyl-CoA transferase